MYRLSCLVKWQLFLSMPSCCAVGGVGHLYLCRSGFWAFWALFKLPERWTGGAHWAIYILLEEVCYYYVSHAGPRTCLLSWYLEYSTETTIGHISKVFGKIIYPKSERSFLRYYRYMAEKKTAMVRATQFTYKYSKTKGTVLVEERSFANSREKN